MFKKRVKQAEKRARDSALEVLSRFRERERSVGQTNHGSMESTEHQKKLTEQSLTKLGFGLREFRSGTSRWDKFLTANDASSQGMTNLNAAKNHWLLECKKAFDVDHWEPNLDLSELVGQLTTRYHHLYDIARDAQGSCKQATRDFRAKDQNSKRRREWLREHHPWRQESASAVGITRREWWSLWLDTVLQDIEDDPGRSWICETDSDFLFKEPKKPAAEDAGPHHSEEDTTKDEGAEADNTEAEDEVAAHMHTLHTLHIDGRLWQ